jgi:hypothetical protein
MRAYELRVDNRLIAYLGEENKRFTSSLTGHNHAVESYGGSNRRHFSFSSSAFSNCYNGQYMCKCIVLTVPPDDTTIAEIFGDSDVTVCEPILLFALKI